MLQSISYVWVGAQAFDGWHGLGDWSDLNNTSFHGEILHVMNMSGLKGQERRRGQMSGAKSPTIASPGRARVAGHPEKLRRVNLIDINE